MDVRDYNQEAWDRYVEQGDEFTVPVDEELIAYARLGEYAVFLSPGRPAPQEWFPPPGGLEVLVLGGGGGQQGPVLAAAGANVTVLDISPRQLEQDQWAAQRFGLSIATVQGDMADLGAFEEARFDWIVHPISNLYVPEVRPVWQECFRVLKPGGRLAAGFMNPAFYIFDRQHLDGEGEMVVRHSLPYSDLESLAPDELEAIRAEGWPLEFSHSLEAQIGGQVQAGFLIAGLYEDRDRRSALYEIMPVFLATLALKPGKRSSKKPGKEIK
jgi:SAM-dependent methyltransferase